MDAWAQHFVKVWQDNRVAIAEAMIAAVRSAPNMSHKDYTLEDVQQVFDGVLAMMVEKINGEGAEIRDTYMNSVVPGLLDQGNSLAGLVGQCCMNGMIIHNLLVPRAQKKYRAQISEFVINYYAALASDTVTVGLENGAKS